MTIAKLVMSNDLYSVIKNHIDIPGGVTNMTLTLKTGEPVTVTFTKFADKASNVSFGDDKSQLSVNSGCEA